MDGGGSGSSLRRDNDSLGARRAYGTRWTIAPTTSQLQPLVGGDGRCGRSGGDAVARASSITPHSARMVMVARLGAPSGEVGVWVHGSVARPFDDDGRESHVLDPVRLAVGMERVSLAGTAAAACSHSRSYVLGEGVGVFGVGSWARSPLVHIFVHKQLLRVAGVWRGLVGREARAPAAHSACSSLAKCQSVRAERRVREVRPRV